MPPPIHVLLADGHPVLLAAGLPYFGEHVAAELARQYVRERGGD